MTNISVDEARTHLDDLLERVRRGETITIVRDGIPVAELAPVADQPAMTVQEAIEGLRELRKGQRLDGLSVRDLIDEGRR